MSKKILLHCSVFLVTLTLIALAKGTIRDTRVKYRILGFRLIIGCLESDPKGDIYSLLLA